jgi:hypothetical protein
MGIVATIVLSLALTLALMIILPKDLIASDCAAQPTGSLVGSMDIDQDQSGVDTEKVQAEYEFNNACANSLLAGCNIADFQKVLSQCQKAFGNLTLEECRSRCCDYEKLNNQTPSNDPGIFAGMFSF